MQSTGTQCFRLLYDEEGEYVQLLDTHFIVAVGNYIIVGSLCEPKVKIGIGICYEPVWMLVGKCAYLTASVLNHIERIHIHIHIHIHRRKVQPLHTL